MVISPVIESEAESGALIESLSEDAKSAAEVLCAKGRLVVTSVAPELVKLFPLDVLSFKSKAMDLPSFLKKGEVRSAPTSLDNYLILFPEAHRGSMWTSFTLLRGVLMPLASV